ncbi:MAG: hypothetical protein LBR06_08975 [Bacteroidales bacterium]|jgi:hypothetical protein|nr:hypothetical protein [Bacteroidales bacterium]
MSKNQEIAGQARNDGVLKNQGNNKNLTKIQVQTKEIAGQARNDGTLKNQGKISGSDSVVQTKNLLTLKYLQK